jgi:hypothetical protein
VKNDYFGNKASSIFRLGEHNLEKGKIKNGELIPSLKKGKKGVVTNKYSFQFTQDQNGPNPTPVYQEPEDINNNLTLTTGDI